MKKKHKVLVNKPTNNTLNAKTSLFGDFILSAGPTNQKSWAEATKAFIPKTAGASKTLQPVIKHNDNITLQGVTCKTYESHTEDEEGWQLVGHKGKILNSVQHKTFIVPTQNRFKNLEETSDHKTQPETNHTYKCPICKLHFRNENLLNIHKTTAHETFICCPDCGCSFKARKEAEDHQKSVHGENKRKRNVGENNLSELDKERKMHLNTKKSLEALNVEYTSCKKELGTVQEEKERLKIKVKDLEEFVKLNKHGGHDIDMVEITPSENEIPSENIVEIHNCPECDYPCSTMDEKKCHLQKHKEKTVSVEINQICTLCKIETNSLSEFRDHIQLKHISEFNCKECDFQGSTQTILSKHMNLKHRKENEVTKDTHRCTSCNEEFSAKWNLNNHIRDKHKRTDECKFFTKGRCQFPQEECWNKHITIISATPTTTENKTTIECFTCKNTFKSKNEMMIHRIEIHPEKCRPCKDQVGCGFKKCWYLHSTKQNEAIIENPSKNIYPENESNFQEAPEQPKPPYN